MKLSQILGRILTDVALRKQNPEYGVCALVDKLMEEGEGWSLRIDKEFEEARKACTQTDSYVYPVANEDGDRSRSGASRRFARSNGTMWRGQYGINRRKLVRDCWRWAKERGL